MHAVKVGGLKTPNVYTANPQDPTLGSGESFAG